MCLIVKHSISTALPDGIKLNWAGEGEWDITISVFRDLGLAFGAAMIGIYISVCLYIVYERLMPSQNGSESRQEFR